MKQVAKAYPRRELQVVLDNYHAHKHTEVQAGLAKNPRITLHFIPASSCRSAGLNRAPLGRWSSWSCS